MSIKKLIAENFLKNLQILSIFIILVSFPHKSSQQGINTIETHCILSFDPQGNYNCYLFNVRTNFSTDTLEIVGSHLPNLTDADVHGVIHRDCFIKQFNGEVLRKFNNLKKLDLSLSYSESISSTAFEVCEQLEEIKIGSNPLLLELPLKMLANCEHLKIFSAVSSRFLTLPGDIFGSSRNLEIFDVSHGRLSSLSAELFINMTNLKVFNIWNCKLTRISPKLFENVQELKEVDLTGNQLSDQQEVMELLDKHLSLKKVSVSYNSFPMFNLSFFAQFKNLEELAFGGNQNLTDINWQSLPNSLKVLKTYQIGVEIPENAFEGLPNLVHLYLSGLGITTLEKDTFKPLTKLDRLEIVSTRLSALHSQLFLHQLNLSYLSLNFNEIEELPAGVFAPLVNLGHREGVEGLFMVMNKLHTLSSNSFGLHPNLSYIDFSYNKINKIQRGIFSRFNPVPAIASFTRNECIDWPFSNEGNLDEHKYLELCFNNFDGIPTTTPNSAWNGFRGIESLMIIFIGFLGMFLRI